MRLMLLIAAILMIPAAAQAQEIVHDPLCFNVINQAPYKVYGSFVTDYYDDPSGVKAKHRSNFRLDEPGSVDDKGYPSDRAEFCSYGPFYPEHKLELVLRTLVPIFSCKTKIDAGDIVIKGKQKSDGLGTDTWAECFE